MITGTEALAWRGERLERWSWEVVKGLINHNEFNFLFRKSRTTPKGKSPAIKLESTRYIWPCAIWKLQHHWCLHESLTTFKRYVFTFLLIIQVHTPNRWTKWEAQLAVRKLDITMAFHIHIDGRWCTTSRITYDNRVGRYHPHPRYIRSSKFRSRNDHIRSCLAFEISNVKESRKTVHK